MVQWICSSQQAGVLNRCRYRRARIRRFVASALPPMDKWVRSSLSLFQPLCGCSPVFNAQGKRVATATIARCRLINIYGFCRRIHADSGRIEFLDWAFTGDHVVPAFPRPSIDAESQIVIVGWDCVDRMLESLSVTNSVY